jgi:hypothetical protein
VTALELRVFDRTGTQQRGWIVNPIGSRFSDEFNAAGLGEVTVLLDSPDAELLVKDAVVRVYYKQKCVFAWFVENLDRTITEGNEQRTLRASGRGILGWLDDAVIYPQNGFSRYATTDRMFNFASNDGPWMKNTNYRQPVGVRWKDDTSVRKGQPRKWPNPNAMWIWSTDPTKPVKEGETNWFRSSFNLAEPERVRFHMSADNRYEVYLDGAPLFTSTSSRTQSASWSQMSVKTLRVPAGKHIVAARIQNEKPFSQEGLSMSKEGTIRLAEGSPYSNGVRVEVSDASKDMGIADGTYFVVKVNTDKGTFQLAKSAGGAPVVPKKNGSLDLSIKQDTTAGFLLTASSLDGKNRNKALVEVTNQKGWLVATVEPEWEPAEILWALIREAQNRGVSRLDNLTKGWTDSTDSAGQPWKTRVDATFPVGTPLTGVMDYGINLGIDYWVEPDTFVIKATEQRGKDVSNRVRLDIARNLINFATTEERTLKTAALVRTKDGWTEKRWMDGFYGRRETFVTVERTRSNVTGRKVAQKRLEVIGRRTVVADTAAVLPVAGVDP